MPIEYDNSWAVAMTVEQMKARIIALDVAIAGTVRRGKKPMLKKQRQEILNELEKRGVLCHAEDQ